MRTKNKTDTLNDRSIKMSLKCDFYEETISKNTDDESFCIQHNFIPFAVKQTENAD